MGNADPRPATVGELVERHLGGVHWFCLRMGLRADEAAQACFETFARASAGTAPAALAAERLWLLKIAAHVVGLRLPATPEVSFALLDEMLRSEATRTGEAASPTDSARRERLLWELKQGCLTAVLGCLPPGERVAFVLSSVMALSDEDAARALGITPGALKVRLSRARKKVGDYLAPRCEHVDPRNPCRCPSRLGVALRNGFIAPPARAEVSLRALPTFDEQQHLHDAVAIYRTLPEPEPTEALRARIAAAVASGAWL